MPKPGVAHSAAEREKAELAHKLGTGAVVRPAPRADFLALLACMEEDPPELVDTLRSVLSHGIAPREVQALLARQLFVLATKAEQARIARADAGADGKGMADLELQYERLKARVFETLRKTVADHEEADAIERIIIVIQQSVESGGGDIIPVE